jgi:hypothetical protein
MNQSETTLSSQESDWIDECASRLRLIQADSMLTPREKRRQYLQEELNRSFKEVATANRQRFLNALLARFPISGQVVESTLPSPAPPSAKPTDETVDQVLERLLTMVANLPEEKCTEIAQRLSEAGLAWVDRDAIVLEISDSLRKRLGLKPDQKPHLSRVVELAIFLVEAVVMLDQTTLKTMHELAPRSALLSRSEDFRKTAARFLTESNGSLDQQWTAIRALLGGLLAAIQGGGKDFGRQFVERLSPSSIEDVIVSEGSKIMPFGPNKKERCWERYKDLFEETYSTPDLVDRKIKDCLAAFVERAVR